MRILLLADTHLGLDHPRRPRVERRRRGPEMLAAFEEALAPARRREVDAVVHGGDLLDRRKAPAWLVDMALAPLRAVADQGVPVFLVPGNHEGGRIPLPLLARHPGLHIFDRPRTFETNLRGTAVAFGGFPFERRVDGERVRRLAEVAGISRSAADVRLLCMHQAVEGAIVGAQDFVFRSGPDVIPGQALPRGLAAVLTGHIHRAQVLRQDLAGRALPCPVVYPGATQRTSFAERLETKGRSIVDVETAAGGGRLAAERFAPLPCRPMVLLPVDPRGMTSGGLAATLRRRLAPLDPDAIVRVVLEGEPPAECRGALTAASLRALAPSTMTVTLPFRRNNL